MNCPSAFFTDEPEDTMPVSSAPEDLRLLASSEVGYSELWRCREEGKFLILKALKPQYRNVPVYEDLLRKEFSLGYELEHPNICRTYGYKHYPELGHCIIMQWIDGEPLRSMLPISDKKLSRKIVSQLCDVLEYIHSKQVIHKDLKPENILITHNGQNVKLIDFGLSDSDDYALLKFHAGTQLYAAPELLYFPAEKSTAGQMCIHSGRCCRNFRETMPVSQPDVRRTILTIATPIWQKYAALSSAGPRCG